MALYCFDHLHRSLVHIILWTNLRKLQTEIVCLCLIISRVEGFELNYLVMNISGYTLYGIYSTLGYFFHEKGAGTVVIADLFFVYHALAMVFIQTCQVLYYPRGKNRISGFSIMLCLFIWASVLVEVFFTIVIF